MRFSHPLLLFRIWPGFFAQARLLDGYVFVLFYFRLCLFLRNSYFQDTIFKSCLDVFFRNMFTNEKAPAAGSGKTNGIPGYSYR